MPNIGPAEIVVLLVLFLIPSVLVAKYASNKGHSFALFLILGLVASWLIALLVALIVNDRTETKGDDHLDQLQKLTELREAGTLSPEEFEAEKARILGETATRR